LANKRASNLSLPKKWRLIACVNDIVYPARARPLQKAYTRSGLA
jgi:hypothetical protein